MGVQFSQIPAGVRVPLFYVELSSGGTTYKGHAVQLLFGQKLASGTAPAGKVQSLRDSQWPGAVGNGSMLHGALQSARLQDEFAEIHFVALDDDPAGVAATGSVKVAGTPVARSGTAALYIAGRRVRIAVQPADTNATIATALALAINKTPFVYVTAQAAGDTITLTARHKGDLGNDIMIDHGEPADEGPLGATLFTITDMAGGTGNPEVAAFLANLGDVEYDWIGSPYADQTNLSAMTDFLGSQSGRWSPMQQIYGHHTVVTSKSYANATALGNAQNDQHLTIFPAYKFRSPPWETAAAVNAAFCKHLQSAPELSRPLQTIPLRAIAGPLDISHRLNVQERNTHYYDGLSGFHFRRDGTVAIDSALTTYKQNEWGTDDFTYLHVNIQAQLMYILRSFKNDILRIHGRQALVDEVPEGAEGVASPAVLRETILHTYQRMVSETVTENFDRFAQSLVVERSTENADRIDVSVKLDHANALRIVAMAAQSYLQTEQVRAA